MKFGTADWFYLSVLLSLFIIFLFLRFTVVPRFTFMAFVSAMADASLLTLPCLLLRGKWKLLIFIFLPFVAALITVNILYFQFFDDLIPASVYFVPDPFNPAVTRGAGSAFKWYYAILVIVPFIPLLMGLTMGMKRFFAINADRKILISVLLLSIVSWFVTIGRAYRLSKPSDEMISLHQFYMANVNPWNNNGSFVYTRLNFPAYILYCVNQDRGVYDKLSSRDKEYIGSYLEKRASQNGKTGVSNPRKYENVIFIVVESLPTSLLETDYSDEVLPYFKSLIKEERNIFFSAESLIGHGNSSDAHFIYLTGLLPLKTEPLVLNYSYKDFPSLIKAFNSNSKEIICEDKSLWSQNITSRSYGFERLIDCVAPPGTKDQDSLILRKAGIEVDNLESPFFMFVTTFSMHEPYGTNAVTEKPALKLPGNLGEKETAYLQNANHFDRSLKSFINALKSKGLYDNSLIIIAGDHQLREKESPERYRDPHVPVLILNAEGKPEDKPNYTQIDVFPTILDLLGIDYHYRDIPFRGLGTSIFSPTYIPITDEDYRVSEMIIKSDY